MLRRVSHLMLIVVVSLALATPASAGCCFGPVAVGQAFLGLAVVGEPSSDSTLAMYAELPDAVAAAEQPAITAAPPIFCYLGGCYHLQGNGVSAPYRWVWMATGPGEPPAPPPVPAGVR